MQIKSGLQKYFIELYEHTKSRLYREARRRIAESLSSGGYCLDCGAGGGHQFRYINEFTTLPKENYFGIEWTANGVLNAQNKKLQVLRGDLNQNLPFDTRTSLRAFRHLQCLRSAACPPRGSDRFQARLVAGSPAGKRWNRARCLAAAATGRSLALSAQGAPLGPPCPRQGQGAGRVPGA